MKKVTSFILAGGKSSRMGMDKGFCKIGQEEFIPRIAKCLTPFSQEVVLVSGLEAYDVFGLKRIEDIYPGKGPIAGIQAALEYTSTENNIIMSCDIPFISPTLIQRLVDETQEQDVIHLATRHETMPLAALYKKSCRTYFKSRLEKDELKLRDALKGLQVKNIQVAEEEERFLSNINTPQELKKINHDR
ncbi:MAG: molybdenum cofactor guanylyltransferase [Tetragenococcus koreensis]|nr:molybdenum cofactor guanylyltransferase [Tetragenococcus koreensis]MDN6309689.1 molybdenum cofactor guanylyltransferase [Psychroflexus sp.]